MKRKGNKIGWCDKTCNPVTGCPNGCEYCYARSMNNRFHWVEDFSKPQFFPDRLKEFRTKEPMIIFIDSMSDIGYWAGMWLKATYNAMVQNPQNIYLALTKNLTRFKELWNLITKQEPYPRFYIGATVTNNAQAQAVIDAGGADFISFEPLLERIMPDKLEQLRCKWWIVGDLTKGGKPQGVTCFQWVDDMIQHGWRHNTPIFMKDSLKYIVGETFRQEFPSGWKGE